MKITASKRSLAALFLLLSVTAALRTASVSAAELTDPAAQGTDTQVTAPADPAAVTPAPKKNPRANKWKTKNGYTYYYGDTGKKVTGMQKIGKRYFLFDKKGRQLTGWQKVGKQYYFFRLKNGKYGYRLSNKTVNGIRLKKNGRVADRSSSRLALLVKCQQVVESHTKPSWSKSQKMQTVWNWMQNNVGYWNVRYTYFGGWGVHYAMRCFSEGGGSCEGLGCLWAFLANACGASNCYCVASGGHGWAEVEGRVYDPACARYDGRRDSYYAMDMGMSGVGGRPRYAGNGIYREKV